MNCAKKQLIIGQGLAGSLLAMQFLEKGIDFEIISADLPYSASNVAAGILNPVTGKRLALSWRYGEFFDFAEKQYAKLEKILNERLFQKMPVLRMFQNEKEIEAYEKRKGQPEFTDWLGKRYNPGEFGSELNDPLGSFEILGAAALDTKQVVHKLREWLLSNGLLIEEKFTYEHLKICEDGLTWADKHYANAIFCEGYRIQNNPWFRACPLELAAGEIQTISIQAQLPPGILNGGKWIRPIKGEKYLAGSTYTWENLESPPNEDGLTELEAGIRKFLSAESKVLERKTGVRPVVKDRKPILGSHPQFPQLKVFNGLGSKGSLMAPLLAKQLSEVILIPEEKLEPVIDVGRFSEFFM